MADDLTDEERAVGAYGFGFLVVFVVVVLLFIRACDAYGQTLLPHTTAHTASPTVPKPNKPVLW